LSGDYVFHADKGVKPNQWERISGAEECAGDDVEYVREGLGILEMM
jgi:hypothetical protein